MAGNTITHDGREWTVLSRGAERDEKTYCHLASTTLGRWQRNGFYPTQICDWVPSDKLAAIKAANA